MSAEAGDNAGLLKKLVEKGIISEGEAAVLAEEANSEFNNSMPSWVNSLTLKGDLRLRYDHTYDSASNGASAEDRWRYRFRFGGTAEMNNGVKTGFRLASGGTSDLGSTNTTIDGGCCPSRFKCSPGKMNMCMEGQLLSKGAWQPINGDHNQHSNCCNSFRWP